MPPRSSNAPPSQKSTKSKKENYEKRREQIRRAQRNHRKRKDDYLKSLEEEVIRLRRQCMVSFQDRKLAPTINVGSEPGPNGSQNQQDEAALPMDNAGSERGGDKTARRDEMMDTSSIAFGSHFTMEVTLSTSSMSLTTIKPELIFGTSPTVPIVDEPEAFELYLTSCPLLQSRTTSRRVSLASAQEDDTFSLHLEISRSSSALTDIDVSEYLETCQTGTDFILALERPCQALQIEYRCCPDVSVRYATARTMQTGKENSGPGSSSTMPVPSMNLDRLLKLSMQLNLSNELTPVQIWAMIKRHSKYHELGNEGLEKLKFALMAEVRWSGFGAIVDQEVFEALLDCAFVKQKIKEEAAVNVE